MRPMPNRRSIRNERKTKTNKREERSFVIHFPSCCSIVAMELGSSSPLDPGCDLAVTSFVASRHPTESCGANGLPLTPKSISILGRAQKCIKDIAHPNLCALLDCRRGKQERIVLIESHYNTSILDHQVSFDNDDDNSKEEDRLLKVISVVTT